MTHVAILLVPTIACLVVAMASSGIQRRLAPAAGATLLTGAAIASAGAVVLALGAIGFAYLAEVPWMADTLGWCRELSPIDDHVPTPLGVATLVALGVSGIRGFAYLRRATWHSSTAPPEIVVVQSSVVEAVAVPGDPGRIVVSSAMMDVLDDDEREAMLAHECAHLQHRHHRFLVLAGFAAAAVPLVRPISTRVRFCTERWADESAAVYVGDRSLVARAIAKAALASVGPPSRTALALLGLGVPGRIGALLGPQRRSGAGGSMMFVTGFVGLAMSIGASTVQLHHVIGFARHVCGVN